MIMRKYKFSWRINQLSKPLRKVRKFVPKPETVLKAEKTKVPKISQESAYYADQMSRPPLRLAVFNKKQFGKQNGKKYRRIINKNIQKAWDSIYNYYKKKERDRRLRFKNLPKPIDPGKVRRSALRYKATPRIETIAQPKQRREKVEDDDFDPFQISKNALKYKPTPRILELAKPKEYD
nr:unnamed protein product [Callosobruchus chinensis]